MRILFSVLLLSFLLPQICRAETVRARLIADQNAVVSGQDFRIGVVLNIPAGWHIYGRTVGDVGLPTRVAWQLPDGIMAREIIWPIEDSFTFQGISGQGYTGQILLTAVMTTAKNLHRGDAARIAAHVEWLVCKDICVPESADLLLNLSVATRADASAEAKFFSPDNKNKSATGVEDFLRAVVLAFAGGLILNLMPCVFPILSMKALGLVKKSHYEERIHVVHGGLAYAAGVIFSFWALAGVLIVLKIVGISAGWGVQMQSPFFIAILIAVLLVLGLMFSDIIRVGDSFANIGDNLTRAPSHMGTFFTGALAVLVATPCTAPFMGGAMFYSFTQSWLVTLAIFSALGMGLAAPYLLLTLYPPALKILPRPGRWMMTFKKILALPMYAAALWLMWVLAQQTMILPRTTHAGSEPYSAARLSELRAAHQPVFVNMTAAWCITCIFNEKNALGRAVVRDAFKASHIAYLVGDWTNRDAAITDFLAAYDRIGVPLYVYFPPRGTPVVLPQILTPEAIQTGLSQGNP